MAVIISFLSANNIEKAKDKFYKLPNDIPTKKKKFKARYTNEAPLYYLTEMAKEDLKKDGKSNEKIKYLFIVSKKVFDEDKPFKKVGKKIVPAINGEEGDCTFFEYYTNRCLKFSKNKCEFVSIPYDFKEENGEFKGIDESKVIANNIYENINSKIEDKEKVYIDYTGGFRDISYLLVTLIQYLEIKNVTCESIVYSQQNPYKVRRIKFIYKINTIIQGAHDFIATGDITKLKEFFNGEKKYEKINNLINELDNFVKAVSIGQVAELEDIKNEINSQINDFEHKNTSDSEADLYRNIFTLLFPKIKGSLYIDGENNKFGYLEIVKWCIAHRFIQQAFTIYVEKFPEIYLKHGIDGLISDEDVKPTLGSSLESTKFYTNFYEAFALTREEKIGMEIRKRFFDNPRNKSDKFEIFEDIIKDNYFKNIKLDDGETIYDKLNDFKDCVHKNYKKEKKDLEDMLKKAMEDVQAKENTVEVERGNVEKQLKTFNNVKSAEKAAKKVKIAALEIERLLNNIEIASKCGVKVKVDKDNEIDASEVKNKAKEFADKAKVAINQVEELLKGIAPKEKLIVIESDLTVKPLKDSCYVGFSYTPTDESKFINSIMSDKTGKFVYYLTGKGDYFEEKIKVKTTNVKKCEAIKKLADNGYEELANIMRAYLCVKIIRNNMNHAATNDTEKDETKLLHEVSKQILADDKIAVSDVFSYDVAKRIIDKGVEITENIVKENKPLLTEEQYEELTGAK